MARRGTWQQTGGGLDFLGPLIGFGILAGAVIGTAMFVLEFLPWVIAAAVIAGIVWVFNLRRIARNKAALDAHFARECELRREEASDALAAQRQHELKVAAASASQVNVHIDPAAILSAFAAALHTQPQPQPARVIRGEVER